MSFITENRIIFDILDPTQFNISYNCNLNSSSATLSATAYAGCFYRKHIHFNLSLFIIICGGILGNILNIVVFNQPKLKDPMTSILKSISYAQLISQVARLPYMFLIEAFRSNPAIPAALADDSIGSAVFNMLFYVCSFIVMFPTTTVVYLTLLLASWRFIAVRYPFQSQSLCTEKRKKKAILAAYLIGVCTMIYHFYAASVTVFPDVWKSKHGMILMLLPTMGFYALLTLLLAIIGYKLTLSLQKSKKTYTELPADSFQRVKLRESINMTTISLYIINFAVFYNSMNLCLEFALMVIEEFQGNLHKYGIVIMYTGHLLQIIDASNDFFIYYASNYKSFRKEVHSVMNHLLCCLFQCKSPDKSDEQNKQKDFDYYY